MSNNNRQLITKPLEKKNVDVLTNQKILEEDVYEEALTKIIQRDFFPDLPRLKQQLQYLEALESGDPQKIMNAKLGMQKISGTPSGTPFSPWSGTPARTMPSPAPANTATAPNSENPSVDQLSKLGLDEFLSNYTSEDNASFSMIINKMKEKHREYYNALSEAERQKLLASEKQLMIEGPAGRNQTPASIESWKYTAKNNLMFIDDRKAVPEEHAVMGPPKEISHASTRFNSAVLKEQEQFKPPQAPPKKPSELPPPGFGRRQAPAKYDLDDLYATPKPKGTDESMVGGYSFVATPSPAPGMNGEASPLMTWGEIEGTPLLLDPSLTPAAGPTFKVAQTPLREKVGMDLANKIGKQMREKKRASIATATSALTKASPSQRYTPYSHTPGTPSTPASRFDALSPAAQKLLTRSLASKTKGADLQLASSYSSSPMLRTRTASTPNLSAATNTTPKPVAAPITPLRSPKVVVSKKQDKPLAPQPSSSSSSTDTQKPPATMASSSSITDNLLNL